MIARRPYIPGTAPASRIATARGALLALLSALSLAVFAAGLPLALAMTFGKV